MAAPFYNRNGDEGDDRLASTDEGGIIEDWFIEPEGEAAESKQCDFHDTNTRSAPAASENKDAHKRRNSKDPNVSDGEALTKKYEARRLSRHRRYERTHYYGIDIRLEKTR